MRICFVAEGCYPYVVGGVSGWIHSMIRSFPNVEFVLLTIITDRKLSKKFVYELPENLTEVYEIYIDDLDWDKRSSKGPRVHLSKVEFEAVRSLILNEDIQWRNLFRMFQEKEFSIDDLLMSRDFLEIITELYHRRYQNVIFTDFLWTMRSIYLPLFTVLKSEFPKADLYHCVATGYSGVVGCMAKETYGCGLLVSEHGIYTREREEELIKADWVASTYKSIWAEQFRKMSYAAYQMSDTVTSLFSRARDLQIELGCPPQKIQITPNGIDVKRFQDIQDKQPDELDCINIGAVLRVTPIKDVKTMILAFSYAKERCEKLRLWIMGPADEDPDYAAECYQLVDSLHVKDVFFTGRVDVREYLGRMDMTILTSISEGQPLTILESYAVRKPVIATNVGNCRELIYGEAGDELGAAGILTHIMDIGEIANAMVTLANDPDLRSKMGDIGYERLRRGYLLEHMHNTYRNIYIGFAASKHAEWSEDAVSISKEVKKHGWHWRKTK